jgi:hypothetical protein
MVDVTVQNLAGMGNRRTAWHVFLALATVATVLPFIVAPLAAEVMPDGTTGYLLFVVLSFLGGNFHVATTGWFFADPEMRGHFRRNKDRYVRLPVLLVAFTTLCGFIPTLFPYILAGYYAWQLWHYQKQNIGLLSFISAGTSKVPLSAWERRTLMLAWLPAGITPLKLLLSEQLFHQVQTWGLMAYGPVAIAFCIALFKTPDLRANVLRIAFFLSGVAFFTPLYIFTNTVAAVSSFAIAHGLQYLVFMGTLNINRQSLFRMAALTALAVVGALVLDQTQVGMLSGLFIGLVAVHYVYDADIWRLREPFQRAYMRKRFAFVFDR